MEQKCGPLRTEELEAIHAWADAHGPTWKTLLIVAWLQTDFPGVGDEHATFLNHLRDQRGPSWLARFSLDGHPRKVRIIKDRVTNATLLDALERIIHHPHIRALRDTCSDCSMENDKRCDLCEALIAAEYLLPWPLRYTDGL